MLAGDGLSSSPRFMHIFWHNNFVMGVTAKHGLLGRDKLVSMRNGWQLRKTILMKDHAVLRMLFLNPFSSYFSVRETHHQGPSLYRDTFS